MRKAPITLSLLTLILPLTVGLAAAQDKPRMGGELRFGMPFYPPCLDTIQRSSTPAAASQVLANLTEQDPKTGKILPWLAKSFATENEGKTYVFTLRDDVKMSNGEKLTAQLVKENFDLLFKMGKEGKAARVASYFETLQKVTTRGDSVVALDFDKPYPAFAQISTEKELAILAKATLDKPLDKRCTEGVVSAGPFVFDRIRVNEEILLKKNKDYTWNNPIAKHQGPTYLDAIRFITIPEVGVMAGSLSTGELDGFWGASAETVPLIEAAGGSIMVGMAAGTVYGMTFNTSNPILADRNVRAAVLHAVDRAAVIQGALTKFDEPARSVLSPITPAFIDLSDLMKFDPAESKRLLDAAGWVPGPDGIRVKEGKRLRAKIIFQASPQAQYEIVQQQLKAIGFDLQVARMSPGDVITAQQSGRWDITENQNSNSDGNVLVISYHTKLSNFGTRAPDPELDGLLDAQGVEMDEAKRVELLQKVQRMLIEKAYVVPINPTVRLIALGPKMKGLQLGTNPFRPYFEDVWLAP